MDEYDYLMRRRFERARWRKFNKENRDEISIKFKRKKVAAKIFISLIIFPFIAVATALLLRHLISLIA